MEKNPLNILELDKIKTEVQRFAETSIGKEIISGLGPVPKIEYVKERLNEVTAGKEILNEYGVPPFGGIRDIRQVLKKVDKGIVLSTKELVDIRSTLSGFSALRSFFNELISNLDPRLVEKRLSLVTDVGRSLEALPQLVRELNRCLDDYGEVTDHASNRLANLRSEMDRIGNRIRDKLDSIVKSSKYQKILQDSLITRRGDRYVVPVKHEHRNTFAGIVHDQSSSGMTLFMEPLAIVNLNNRLREVQREEEAEIYRILQALTGLVQEDVVIIKGNLKQASILDVIFARAGYSQKIKGIAPEVNKEGIVKINQGRHPLLREVVVPIDLAVGGDFTSLIITGPNTGGKTVALKTLGLFVLMIESGLHIPAERGTVISVFKRVYADIGDEQSIEQNLSTFSSHINRIKAFLLDADRESLVLMDELGAGTDPKEGAALGIAILERLRSRKVVTVVTTHYSQLKSYAYSQTGVENASVEFDIETLQPTYKLLMGIPGGSNAFAIALKLGIPADIIDEAKNMLSGHDIEIEDIIAGLNADRKKYQELKESFAKKEREVSLLKQRYDSLISNFKEEKAAIIDEARKKAKDLIDEARRESRNLVNKLKQAELASRSEIDRTANQLNQGFKKMDDKFKEDYAESAEAVDQEITVGTEVRLKSGGQKGEVLEIDEEKQEATIQAGIMTVTASLSDLIIAEMPDHNKEELVKRYRVKKTARVSPKLDLRGERYDVAQHKLDKYLDDAFLAGLKQVEIIHGKGTGALREAVSDLLESNPHVDDYRLGRQEEGGTGVTIALLQ